jgi:hypothetical protein
VDCRPAVKIAEMDPLPDRLAVVVVPPELPVVGPVVVFPDVEGVPEVVVDGEGELLGVVDGEGVVLGDVVGDGVCDGVAIGTSGVGVEVSGGNGLDTFCVLVAGVLHFDPLGGIVLLLLAPAGGWVPVPAGAPGLVLPL